MMPGILPMKVIKVGNSAQARIAQACDRCRSKKIRCDGVRPCCTQCANVGFECRTSDKLSRRAFPRGYTESLEERVRALETEVRDLKTIIDEKDDKIDVLSRIRSGTRHLVSPKLPALTSDHALASNAALSSSPTPEEILHIHLPSLQTSENHPHPTFAGLSCSRTFAEILNIKLQQDGQQRTEIDASLLFPMRPAESATRFDSPVSSTEWKAPPARINSDHLVNIFFRDWNPLFPILHRPSFLVLYQRYMTNPDSVGEHAEIAQLNLVFAITAASHGTKASPEISSFTRQWKTALDSSANEAHLSSLQGLALAQICCIQQGDLVALKMYKEISSALLIRLGLHQSQEHFINGTLSCEMRKRVFWSLYTLDSFAAAMLGLPKQLDDKEVQCEKPIDADDACITPQGLQEPPQSPPPYAISGAFALFEVARLLSKALQICVPNRSSYDITLHTIRELSDELDAWFRSLPSEFGLSFSQDKAATDSVMSQSLIMTLVYHYARTVFIRPAICAQERALPSHIITMAESCRRIIQIASSLQEQGRNFAICMNRDELLMLSGLGLIYQAHCFPQDSQTLRETGKSNLMLLDLLETSSPTTAAAFERVSRTCLPSAPKHHAQSLLKTPILGSNDFAVAGNAPRKDSLPTLEALQTLELTQTDGRDELNRRLSVPASVAQRFDQHNLPGQTLSPQLPLMHRGSSPLNPSTRRASATGAPRPHHEGRPARSGLVNLDFLPFDHEASNAPAQPSLASQHRPQPFQPTPSGLAKPEPEDHRSEWEQLLGNIDNGDNNIYSASYGGPPIDALFGVASLTGGVGNGRVDPSRPHRPETCLPVESLHPADHAGASASSPSLQYWPHSYRSDHPSRSIHTADDMGLTPSRLSNSMLSSSTANDDALSIADDVMSSDWASVSSSRGSVPPHPSSIDLQHQQDILHAHNQNWVGGGGANGSSGSW